MNFFLIALGCGLFVYLVLGLAPLGRRVAVVGGLAVAGVVVSLIVPKGYLVRSGEALPWYATSPVKECIGLATITLGMAAKYFFDAVDARRRQRRDGHPDAKVEFDRWDFLQPFAVSVIVFGAFWTAHGSQAVTVDYLALGFQTGFFWQTILQRSDK